MTTTIDIKPTDEGFALIAATFAEQIIADVRKNRTDADKNLLISLVQTAAYLGQEGRIDLVEHITARLI